MLTSQVITRDPFVSAMISQLRRLRGLQTPFLRICLPAVLASLVTIAMEFITVVFAGRTDQAHLNGVGLANSFFNVICRWAIRKI